MLNINQTPTDTTGQVPQSYLHQWMSETGHPLSVTQQLNTRQSINPSWQGTTSLPVSEPPFDPILLGKSKN